MRIAFVKIASALPVVNAWGWQGHKITARIGEALLHPQVLKDVHELLGIENHASLADVASWPDEIKRQHEWAWTSDYHFIDTPDKCNVDYERDCHDRYGHKDACVAGAILNYTGRVAPGGRNTNEMDRLIALKFLVHYMGDIHQPLHVAFQSDRGGNEEHVELDYDHHRHSALHAIWDTEIITVGMKEHGSESWEQYADDLVGKIKDEWARNATEWAKCGGLDFYKPCVVEMANESVGFACSVAYTHTNGTWISKKDELTVKYYERAAPVVAARLAAGGVRLAWGLNEAFASTTGSAKGPSKFMGEVITYV